MTKQEIRESVARGWCHPKNEKKDMDPDLAEAIVEEVYQGQIDSWNKKSQ